MASSKAAAGRRLSPILVLYIAREALLYFAITFAFFFFIFFCNQILYIARDLLAKSLPLNQVMRLVIYSLPVVIALSAPFAALTGTLMVIGRFSSENEALVILTSGLPYRTIFIPVIVMGILVTVVSFVANDLLLPMGQVAYNKVYREILLSTPELELESNSVKRFQNTTLIMGKVAGRTINNIAILDTTGDGERRVILARNALLKDGGKHGLALDLSQAFMLQSKENSPRDYDYATAKLLRYWVPQEDIMQNMSSVSVSEMSSVDVWKAIKGFKTTQKQDLDMDGLNILDSAFSLENALRQGPRGVTWNQRPAFEQRLVNAKSAITSRKDDRTLKIYTSEFYKKFGMPSSAICFIFLAIPLGLLAKKSGLMMGFIFGLVIALFYWASLLVGQTLVQRMGFSPFWCICLPNVISLGVGLVMCAVRIRK
jgi:lipopolysaccharide export system permease protein